jgi:hypothetical protein
MAQSYIPVHTEDGLSQGEAHENDPLSQTGDVSPIEETANSPFGQTSVTPQEDIPEKLATTTAAASAHESLKS